MTVHVPAGAGESRWVAGDTYTFKATAEDTGGAFTLVEASVPPGAGPPLHVHAGEDEAFYVLSGVIEVTTEEKTVTARPGDLVFLPRGTAHGFHNPGVDAARALILLTPGGFEHFFRAIGRPAEPGRQAPGLTPDDLRRALEAAPRHGVRILLPADAHEEPNPAERLFAMIDAKDVDGLLGRLSDDARVVIGNADPLTGRDAIRAGMQAFFSSIGGLRHRILSHWPAGRHAVTETEVTYHRLDGNSVTLPAASIWHTGDDGLIDDYRVFVDLTPVYAP